VKFADQSVHCATIIGAGPVCVNKYFLVLPWLIQEHGTFSFEKNQEHFDKNPEDYAPLYGGHCANGLSDHHKISGNPNIWLIQER
jgi:hypothetical protein